MLSLKGFCDIMEKDILIDEFFVDEEYDRSGYSSETKGEKFYCVKCGKAFEMDYNEWLEVTYEFPQDLQFEAGYLVNHCICGQCAKQIENATLFDLKHPIVKFKLLMDVLPRFQGDIFDWVEYRLTEHLTEDDLVAINHDAYERLKNAEINSTQDKIKAIREFVSKKTMHNVREYIQKLIYETKEFKEIQERIESIKNELTGYLEKCEYSITGYHIIGNEFEFENPFEHNIYTIEPVTYQKNDLLNKLKKLNKFKPVTDKWHYDKLEKKLCVAILKMKSWEERNGN